MALHIEQISMVVPAGRHALVIVDGASWHGSKLNMHNVTLIKLPPYAPELNPVEQIWHWLRQRKLANRSFKSYEEIVDVSCEAWNFFTEQADLINTMCTRKWTDLLVQN